MSSIQDREIVLAGGSGGLGSAAARLLAAAGAKVTVSYLRNKERADQLADGASIVHADLAVEANRRRLLDSADSLYGLAVFTGDPARVGSPAELPQAMMRSHEVNYMGPVLLAREAAERMKAAGTRGAIVLVSTMQAVSLWAGSTAYAGQKAALIHAAQILAKECRGAADIRVNVICPGVNQAGMAAASIASGKYDGFLKENVIPRFGRADDVALAVRFFLEPDNYITGQVLTIDGGLTL
jgi:NAD(P)-dependent dehydrogenase (short-subunit alcohol dehydrogenase family)